MNHYERARTYRALADRIDQGWAKGTFRDGKGGVCVLGAMQEQGVLAQEIVKELEVEIKHRTLFRIGSIPFFNDAPWRGRWGVTNMLRGLARKHERAIRAEERASTEKMSSAIIKAMNAPTVKETTRDYADAH